MLSFETKDMYMPKMYEDGILRGQDTTFVIYQLADGQRVEVTFNQIKEETFKLIERLKKAGLKKGDRVGVISALRPYWFSLSYACLIEGYIMVCIDPGVPSLSLEHMLLETDVRAIFTSLKKVHLPEELDKHIPVFAIEKDFPLMSKCSMVDPLLDEASKLPEDTFYILFSSGTTSENRKAVLLPHSTVTTGIEYGMAKDTGVYKNTTPYTIRQRDLMLFPPYHIAGLVCLTYDLYCNTQVIMLERLTPNGLVTALQELKPDNICTVPSMLNSLYKKIVSGYTKKLSTKLLVNSLIDISSFLRRRFGLKTGRYLLSSINSEAFGGNMKGFMIGASPIDKEVNKFFLDMGIDVAMAYGLTELGAPLTTTGQGYYPGTAGRVVRHTDKIDIRIVNKDESGRGEVEVLSPYRMISYINEKDNKACFTGDGYFRTGDLGYFDENNCLNICGRIKETIVLRNGEKLLPEEIEDKYKDVDCVKDLAAFKIPGENGCDAFAIAIVKDKAKAIPDEPMIQRVYDRSDRLPAMYRPSEVYVVNEFPLSSSHKVQRFRLTEMVVNGLKEPTTDASLIALDEDETTRDLRKILIEIDGAEWKTKKLTQGLPLNLDSLSTVNLYVAIQDKWDIDLFQSSYQPDTFGELLDTINNFNNIDKIKRADIDLSKYPLPPSKLGYASTQTLEQMIKLIWRVSASGKENLPSDTNFLICSNHRTVLDPGFILISLPRTVAKNTCTVGKAELVDSGILGKIAANQNFIPIDRTGNSIKTLDRCRELLIEGKNITIFPEGTNVENSTKVYQLKDGAAKLSIATGKPIVPVNISGFAEYKKEMGDFNLPSVKNKVHVNFGRAIYPHGKTVEELNRELAKSIDELVFEK